VQIGIQNNKGGGSIPQLHQSCHISFAPLSFQHAPRGGVTACPRPGFLRSCTCFSLLHLSFFLYISFSFPFRLYTEYETLSPHLFLRASEKVRLWGRQSEVCVREKQVPVMRNGRKETGYDYFFISFEQVSYRAVEVITSMPLWLWEVVCACVCLSAWNPRNLLGIQFRPEQPSGSRSKCGNALC
jgi:hypothetical protein